MNIYKVITEKGETLYSRKSKYGSLRLITQREHATPVTFDEHVILMEILDEPATAYVLPEGE